MNISITSNPCLFESEILDYCYEKIGKHSEMSKSDKYFLNGLIRSCAPQKILEVGVSSGGSSAIILNAIKDNLDAKLYSIDTLKNAYRYPDKQAGFIVFEQFSHLLPQWKLFTGGTFANFSDNIPNDCDFCLLDTAHSLPGECLDFLLIYPHLKVGSVVVIHDINLHFIRILASKSVKGVISSCLLFNCLYGNKLSSKPVEYPVSTIGAVQITDVTEKCLENIFNILTLPWTYMPKQDHIDGIAEFIEKKYSKAKRDFFMLCVEAQKNYLK